MPETVESLIRQAIQTLTVPAAEYCPAIPDAWAILERALRLASPTPQQAVPLTMQQLNDLCRRAHIDFCLDKASSFEMAFARAIERAHGIGCDPAAATVSEDARMLDWLSKHADVILPKAVRFEVRPGTFIWSTRPTGIGELREAIRAAMSADGAIAAPGVGEQR